MALEAVVFQQADPFGYADWKDYCNMGDYSFDLRIQDQKPSTEQISNGYWDSPPSSIAQTVKDCETNNSSSPEICAGEGGGGYSSTVAPAVTNSRRKRRRTKSSKNKEEMENQRMTHITVERNRRRQMNDYLAILRSLMPASYAQRGDQASIVGGAINFVKELEQLLQSLEVHNMAKKQHYTSTSTHSHLFSNFFTFPQFSTCPTRHGNSTAGSSSSSDTAEKRSTVADIEVTMVENHANIKILTRKRPKQLLQMLTGFHSISLTVLHLNVTTVDQLVLYSISVKVEDDCQLSTVNVIANAVHDMLEIIQEEPMSS